MIRFVFLEDFFVVTWRMDLRVGGVAVGLVRRC